MSFLPAEEGNILLLGQFQHLQNENKLMAHAFRFLSYSRNKY